MSSFARLPYDLTWIHVATGWSAFGDLIGGPMIVDLDDLQDYKLAAELRSGARRLPPPIDRGPRAVQGRYAPQTWQLLMRTNIRRWHAVQRRIVEGVDAVAVCSQLDYKRLAAPTAEVIPNCYTRPAEPAGRLEVGEPPTIVFPGTMVYEPNADAAEFFVNHVLPRLRRLVPEVRVRLVGSVGKRVKRLGSADGVTATGVVPDITSELRRADILIAPIRYGGGTRLKILEGFAHQIPVVSTTLGHEGLEVVPEEHLLVADDPDEFARACWRLLTDLPLRRRLRTSALELFANNYSWDRIRPKITALAERVARRGLTEQGLKHLVDGWRED